MGPVVPAALGVGQVRSRKQRAWLAGAILEAPGVAGRGGPGCNGLLSAAVQLQTWWVSSAGHDEPTAVRMLVLEVSGGRGTSANGPR
jgi:hypothetical protein